MVAGRPPMNSWRPSSSRTWTISSASSTTSAVRVSRFVQMVVSLRSGNAGAGSLVVGAGRWDKAVPGGALAELVLGAEGVGDGEGELVEPVRGRPGGGCAVGGIESPVAGHGDRPSVLLPVGVSDTLELYAALDPRHRPLEHDVDCRGAGGEGRRRPLQQVSALAGSGVGGGVDTLVEVNR